MAISNLAGLSVPLEFLRQALEFAYKPPRPIRRARMNGKIYLRYSGAHLRVLRAERGVGRPPKAA